MLPRIQLDSNKGDFPYIIRRRQSPVRLCFAMTINKSQGQSFTCIDVDLRGRVFTHGQFYVAMSRVTNVHNLSTFWPGPDATHLENIMFPEVLLLEGM